jgi:hypothetical protein
MPEAPRTRFGILAYGPSGRRHREAAVAVLSVHAHRPDASEIVVLTDRPQLYRWLEDIATIERLDAARIAAWQGPRGDRYRPKIEALRWLAHESVDVVLFDTDTMARRDLTPLADRLAAGALLLHRREYPLAAPPRKGDRSLRREILGRSWQGITPDDAAAMWNGGIIGSSRRHHGVFDRAVAVFDEMRDASRHFAVEQLTYSIVFPAYGPVEEAAPWFDHYWANRDRFDRAIDRFLSAARLENLDAAQAADRLRREPIVAPLDGRRPWWLARLGRLVSRAETDDDHVPESDQR